MNKNKLDSEIVVTETNQPVESPNDTQPEFYVSEDDRYSRLRLIGWWEQEKIAAARVLIVGAGALGNEVLKNLTLLGIGEIYLIDFDVVQESNLSRSVLFRSEHAGLSKSKVAAAAARELNGDCRIIDISGDVLTEIGLGLIRDLDVVVSCVDNREARLWINRMCWKVGTPWVDGGIQEINGVTKVFVPPDGPCYECGMTEKDYQLIQLRYSCPLLKQEDVLQGKVPTAPTIASIIGGLQSQETLKLLHGLPTAEGSALVFNGAANKFYQTKYPYREDCLSHEFFDDIVELPLAANSSTVADLFQQVESTFKTTVESIELDRDLLVDFTCSACDITVPVGRPRCDVSMSEAICSSCEQVMRLNLQSQITASNDDRRKLSEIGIPDYEIVKVDTTDGRKFVLLSEDATLFEAPHGS